MPTCRFPCYSGGTITRVGHLLYLWFVFCEDAGSCILSTFQSKPLIFTLQGKCRVQMFWASPACGHFSNGNESVSQPASLNVSTWASGSVIQLQKNNNKKNCTVEIINQDCWQRKGSGLSHSGDSHAWTHISLNNENSLHWFSGGANNAYNWFKCDPQHGGLSPESSALLRNWPWLRLSSALELQDGWNLNCNVIEADPPPSLLTQEPLIHSMWEQLSNLRCPLPVCTGRVQIFIKRLAGCLETRRNVLIKAQHALKK